MESSQKDKAPSSEPPQANEKIRNWLTTRGNLLFLLGIIDTIASIKTIFDGRIVLGAVLYVIAFIIGVALLISYIDKIKKNLYSILFFASLVVAGYIIFYLPPNATITDPHQNTLVSSNFTVNGTISRIPQMSHLWLVVYNSNLKRYCFFTEIPQEKIWTVPVSLIGGMPKDENKIDVLIVDKRSHIELSNLKKDSLYEKIPADAQLCAELVVTIGY